MGTESASPFSLPWEIWVSSRGQSGTLESVLRPLGRPVLAGPVKSQVPARALSSAAPAPLGTVLPLVVGCARGAPNNQAKPSPAHTYIHMELRLFSSSSSFFNLCGLSADHAVVPLVVQGTKLHPREVEETFPFLPFLRQSHLWTTSPPAQPAAETCRVQPEADRGRQTVSFFGGRAVSRLWLALCGPSSKQLAAGGVGW